MAHIDLNSADFIEKVRNHDNQAVELVVRTYTEQIYRAALGLGFQSSTAEEIVQSVWVTFFDVIANFKGRSHIRTFIFGILYNKAAEMRREQTKLQAFDPIEDIVEDRFSKDGKWVRPPINPEEFLNATQVMAMIEKCLDALPTTQRLAFTLKEVEEEKTPDICNILGVTVTNLGVLLYRARNHLRECIEGKART